MKKAFFGLAAAGIITAVFYYLTSGRRIMNKITGNYQIIEKERKAFEIVKEIVNKSISEWGNVDFNINDYPLLKEVLKNE